MNRNIIISIITILFISLFLYTGLSKLWDYTIFKQQLNQLPFPKVLTSPQLFLIPLMELVTVTLLIIPAVKLAGLYSSLILMILFTAYLIYISIFGVYISCACGGAIDRLPLGAHIIFNTVLILIAFIGIKTQYQKRNVENKKQPD